MAQEQVVLGNERLTAAWSDLGLGPRGGLITNHSGVDGGLVATADRLAAASGIDLVCLFGPEHGIRGDVADGAAVAGGTDQRTGVPVHSLYGPARQPDSTVLADLDALLFDIQDVGARFYTYLYTMSLSMAACAEQGVPFIVLDRPNPIGGVEIEGPVLEPAFASFVGLYPIPIRHGMSMGEAARFFNEACGIGAELIVVEMQGWQRAGYWEQTGLSWVAPSPNMPTVDTAVVYPGLCLCEGTNLSEGRGTARPFEQVGAPFVDGARLADRLNELTLPGVRFRPVYFQPTASKYAGQVCQGVQLHVLERTVFRPVRAGLELLAAVKAMWPDDFAWRVPQTGIYNFDKLAGTDQIRRQLDAGVAAEEVLDGCGQAVARFAQTRDQYLIY
ncbi:MAG: DUF1343 domain-containing protein [Candidatus Latescibacteria bacterium]|nr:DUF1343 domain-containing protein [Candidatus Latescibacterota bacterium]